MLNRAHLCRHCLIRSIVLTWLILSWIGLHLFAAPATLLFQDDFNGGIPGWTAVLPAGGVYLDGPMLWEYDAVSKSFSEQSNLYTDSSTFSGSRIACMLINDTVMPTNFIYSARLTAGDDDSFGLIWGYEGDSTFYRLYFARQNRSLVGWPFQGWGVDRLNNGQITDLYGPDNSTFINAAGRPFDVTIMVTNGLLTLTVVDDPLGSPTVYNLVTDGPLPTVPQNAKVGMFSWGQSGGIPRSFSIQNPALSPTPLAGDPATAVLTNWSFLVTPREDGLNAITSGGTPPIWAQGLGPNGDKGAMIQNSDSYYANDNVAAGTTNFICPTAVAGDVGWSNYVVSARFIPADNDGFGLVLRYQNETNFYRIAFRNQSSQTGVRRGLTVQKNINRVFDQVYSNGAAGFIPPINVPYEVHAAIRSNRLQIIAISNPDSAPLSVSASGATAARAVAASGPIDFDSSVIVPGSLDDGKIGVISWAQYGDNNLPNSTAPDDGTAVDWIKVNRLSGEGLLVYSPVGTPEPPAGVNDFPISQAITASVESTVNIAPGVRQLSIGWTGLGSVPATGATNLTVFNLDAFSSITWRWQAQYFLTTNASPGGVISSTLGPWVNATSNLTVTATALPGFVFVGWSGDSISTRTTLTFPMLRPVTLTANFAVDSDGDGLPDDWEMKYFGNLLQDGAGDPDGDGVSNLDEYRLGTNPNFAETLLVTDGLSSQWVNTSRDPGLPGELTVVDFGSGARGAFGNNNEFRYGNDFAFMPATNYADNASFQSQRMMVRSNLWNPSWGSNFSASAEFTVGDNDGNCFYFRYNNESNWFRVTLCGEDPVGSLVRPFVGLSVQRRLNGYHSNVPTTYLSGPLFAAYTDPTDGDSSITRPANTPAGFKKVRVTVNATNQNFEVHVIGWNVALPVPDFDPNNELVASFTDTNLPSGRIGFGLWGQGGFGGDESRPGLPVSDGALIDNIVVKSPADGPVVFSEDWEHAALGTNLPSGWVDPYPTGSGLEGTWAVNVDGSISELSNQGVNTSGTATFPKADADGPILLAPDQLSANYSVSVGVHQFDDDGIGLVYDFQDTNNYSRVIFRQQATFDNAIPPGLSVSRKSAGIWMDRVAGEPTFLYTPGRPFEINLSNNNGDYTLQVRDLDNLTNIFRWRWAGPAAAATNRFGVATWASQSAHFLYARAYSLPRFTETPPLRITQISLTGGNVVLGIAKPASALYHVLRASSVTGPYVPVATNLSGVQYREPIPAGSVYYRLQLVP